MPSRNAGTLASLTAIAFAVFIVADREEWEARDIRPRRPTAAKVFPLFVKALYPRRRSAAHRLAWGWLLTRSNGPDRGSDTTPRNGRPRRCLTAAGTWEKLQSRIMKYIARINVARYTIPTRRDDISALLVDIYSPNDTSTTCLSLAASEEAMLKLTLVIRPRFTASCVGRACWRQLILSLFNAECPRNHTRRLELPTEKGFSRELLKTSCGKRGDIRFYYVYGEKN